MVPADVNYQAIAQKVFLATDAAKRMREIGFAAPPSSMIKHTVLGKVFDPTAPQAYVDSFAIKKI
jgi:nitrate/nitrite transport system substrate-binding protein